METEIKKLSKRLVGKSFPDVYISDDQGILVFLNPTINEFVAIETTSECCSSTWFEHVDNVEAFKDSIVTKVEGISSNELPDLPEDKLDDDDCIAQYGIKITTSKGHVVIEYRNASNGYYGGDFKVVDATYIEAEAIKRMKKL